jgi:hypothetical protein
VPFCIIKRITTAHSSTWYISLCHVRVQGLALTVCLRLSSWWAFILLYGQTPLQRADLAKPLKKLQCNSQLNFVVMFFPPSGGSRSLQFQISGLGQSPQTPLDRTRPAPVAPALCSACRSPGGASTVSLPALPMQGPRHTSTRGSGNFSPTVPPCTPALRSTAAAGGGGAAGRRGRGCASTPSGGSAILRGPGAQGQGEGGQ